MSHLCYVTPFAGVAPSCSASPAGAELNWVSGCADDFVIATFGAFLLVAGSLILVVSLRKHHSAPDMKPLAIALGVSAVALLTATAALAVVPIHQSFTMHDVAWADLASTCSGIDTVKGTTVSFHWGRFENFVRCVQMLDQSHCLCLPGEWD